MDQKATTHTYCMFYIQHDPSNSSGLKLQKASRVREMERAGKRKTLVEMHEGLMWIEDTNTQTANITKTKAEKKFKCPRKTPETRCIKA